MRFILMVLFLLVIVGCALFPNNDKPKRDAVKIEVIAYFTNY